MAKPLRRRQGQMTDVRKQMTEDRASMAKPLRRRQGQMTEDRGQTNREFP